MGPSANGRPISLNFDDADVYSVMKVIFGDVLRVNYVIDPRVKGRVTFRSLRPVPADQVLPVMEVILRQNGIGVVEESGLYRIVPISELAREPTDVFYGRDASKVTVEGKAIVQVIPILHVSSSEIVKTIAPFLSTNAVLIDVPKGNQIIIVDTDASVKRILRLVDIFDSVATLTRQGPEVFVYAVQNGKAKDIAALLRQIFLSATPSTSAAAGPVSPGGTTPSTQPPGLQSPAAPSPFGQPQVSSAASQKNLIVSEMTKIFADEIINSVIVLATPDDYKLIEKTIKKLDVMARQVVIEGLIAEVDLDNSQSLGMAWSAQSKIGGLKGPVAQNPGDLTAVTPTSLSNSGFTWVGVDEAGIVRGLVTALGTQSKARALATPHILVADNREAHIQVGQQIPIPTSATYGTPGVAPIQTIQYKDIGIILKVKPQVNDSGLVAMEISQEVSTFSTVSISAGSSDIIINKTEAATTLVVPDGQTILIGGLIQTNKTKAVTGIPFLSTIPIIGMLFGDTTGEIKRTEIIILLTPRVIKSQKDARDATSSYIDRYVTRNSEEFKKEDLTKEKTGKIEDNTSR
jgi:general secretion pathway protein D